MQEAYASNEHVFDFWDGMLAQEAIEKITRTGQPLASG
ncbi:Hypothetical protein PFR_JS12-3_24 [Propionibacterium freudenreichii]|nr:Hypothetical protein PFR_JS12-3_24 [Propionibacterium freudenreichii]